MHKANETGRRKSPATRQKETPAALEQSEQRAQRERLRPERQENTVAAFFDLDGTLLPRPSLERRFFLSLRRRRRMGVANYSRWLREAVRLAPRGIDHVLHANKMYLRGVRVDEADCANAEEEPKLRCAFFSEAVERAAWHAKHGHSIVIVSGTLELLAKKAAAALEAELAERGIDAAIEVRATRLEAAAGSWTGRIVGEAMFGTAKARAVRRFAAAGGIDLSRCFAYGDSTMDQWMLEAVGRPVAVNPSDDLARIAKRNGWEVLRWSDAGMAARSSKSSENAQKVRARGIEMQMEEVREEARLARRSLESRT